MNYSRLTLAITAIVVATALVTITFAATQQVMAYRHNHHHNNNHIKVDQQVNQENQCTGQPTEWVMSVPPGSSAICINQGSNSADIGR
jgi:curli biogenesis system outer membrane secretion channel CsgG